MPSLLNNSLSLVVLTSALILSGCASLVPHQHKDYTGTDAATLVIQQEEIAGVVTLLHYENKENAKTDLRLTLLNPVCLIQAEEFLPSRSSLDNY